MRRFAWVVALACGHPSDRAARDAATARTPDAAPPAPLAITAGNPLFSYDDDSDDPGGDYTLYDNGAVICLSKGVLRAGMLEPAALAAKIAALDLPALAREAGDYDAEPNMTDEHTRHLYVWQGGCRSTIYLRGDPATHVGAAWQLSSSTELSADVITTWMHLQDAGLLVCDQTAPWKYDQIEVTVQPEEYRGPPTDFPDWPTDLPPLESARADGDSRILDLPADRLDEVRHLDSIRHRGVLLGIDWAIAWPHLDAMKERAGECPHRVTIRGSSAALEGRAWSVGRIGHGSYGMIEASGGLWIQGAQPRGTRDSVFVERVAIDEDASPASDVDLALGRDAATKVRAGELALVRIGDTGPPGEGFDGVTLAADGHAARIVTDVLVTMDAKTAARLEAADQLAATLTSAGLAIDRVGIPTASVVAYRVVDPLAYYHGQ